MINKEEVLNFPKMTKLFVYALERGIEPYFDRAIEDEELIDKLLNIFSLFFESQNYSPFINPKIFVSANGTAVADVGREHRIRYDEKKLAWVEEIDETKIKNTTQITNFKRYSDYNNLAVQISPDSGELVNIEDLKTFQYFLFPSIVKAKYESDSYEPVTVLKDTDGLYLINGNHRVAALREKGETQVLAIVKEMPASGFYKDMAEGPSDGLTLQ